MKHTIGLVLACSLFALPACSKEKKPDAEKVVGDEDKIKSPEENDGAKAAAGKGAKALPIAAPPSAELASILAHMPADTEILVSLNMASLAGTPLWKKVGPAAIEKAGGGLAKAKDACGFDPVASITNVYFGVNSVRNNEPVLIVKGLSREPILKCVKTLADKERAGVEITEDGNFTSIKDKEKGQTQLLVWLDSSTLLFVPGQENKAYLQARFDGKDGLNYNQDFLGSVAKANQSAPVWFAGNFGASSKAAQAMAAMGGQPKGLFGSVAFAKGVQFALGVTFTDEAAAKGAMEQAKALMGMAKGSMGGLAKLVDNVRFLTEGADLKVSLDLNASEVEQLSNMASMFGAK